MKLVDSRDEWRVYAPPPAKTVATFTLVQLEQWSQEYLADLGGDGSNDMEDRLRLSSFLCWLAQNKS